MCFGCSCSWTQGAWHRAYPFSTTCHQRSNRCCYLLSRGTVRIASNLNHLPHEYSHDSCELSNRTHGSQRTPQMDSATARQHRQILPRWLTRQNCVQTPAGEPCCYQQLLRLDAKGLCNPELFTRSFSVRPTLRSNNSRWTTSVTACLQSTNDGVASRRHIHEWRRVARCCRVTARTRVLVTIMLSFLVSGRPGAKQW